MKFKKARQEAILANPVGLFFVIIFVITWTFTGVKNYLLTQTFEKKSFGFLELIQFL